MSTRREWLLLSLCMTLVQHGFSLDVAPVLQRVCKPSDFGAAGDGSTLDSVAVSKAIAACSSGGGRVVFDAGKAYRLGEITITGSGLQLELPAGTQLLASAERPDYGPHQDSWYLLHFYHCFGCSLTGEGVIQGPARAFTDNSTSPPGIINWRDDSCRSSKQCRPRLVGVRESSGVQITGVVIRDAAFWTLHIRDSDDVIVRGITVTGAVDFPNNDGIDIDGSSRVTLLDSNIATADDAVCIKTTRGGQHATRHVLVSNCTLQSRSAAVKLGSESRADMYNITFRDLRVLESNRGLAIQLRDYGTIQNVTFERISVTTRRFPGGWWGGGEPIYVTALPRWLGSRVGRLVNVTFRGIVAHTHGGVVVLAGSPERTVRGVLLQDVRVRLEPLQPGEPSPAQSTPSASTARDIEEGAARRAALEQTPAVLVARPAGDLTATPAPAGPMQLPVKLDLRPGPYGVRDMVAAAPVLAQFVRDLVLRNVSFELVSTADRGGQAVPPSIQSGKGRVVGQVPWWLSGLLRRPDGPQTWYHELVERSVQVAEAQVHVQVMIPNGTTTSLQDTQLDSPSSTVTESAQQWKQLLSMVPSWWHGEGDRGRQVMWIGISVGFSAVAATLAYVVAQVAKGYQGCTLGNKQE